MMRMICPYFIHHSVVINHINVVMGNGTFNEFNTLGSASVFTCQCLLSSDATIIFVLQKRLL